MINPEINIQPFIFAAGLGTRLRPITLEIPKPLLPVANNDSILELNLNELIRLKYKKVFICYSYREDLFKQIQNNYSSQIEIHLLKDSPASGHAGVITKNLGNLDGIDYLFGINGDTFIDTDLDEFCRNIRGTTVASSNEIESLPKQLICSNQNIIGIQIGGENLHYSKLNNQSFVLKNNLGLYLINLNDFRSLTQKPGFREFFEDDGMIPELVSKRKPVLSKDLAVNSFYSFNTFDEYQQVRRSFSQK